MSEGLGLTLFIKPRMILLKGQITDDLANLVISHLLYCHFEDSVRPVGLMIDSLGGSVAAGGAIRDTMDHIKPPVYTFCETEAHGMAGVLLAHGAKRYRYASPMARISFGPVTPPEPNAGTQANLDRIVEVLTEMLVWDTGQQGETIVQDLRGARQFEPNEALAYGLIDLIGTGITNL